MRGPARRLLLDRACCQRRWCKQEKEEKEEKEEEEEEEGGMRRVEFKGSLRLA